MKETKFFFIDKDEVKALTQEVHSLSEEVAALSVKCCHLVARMDTLLEKIREIQELADIIIKDKIEI